MDPATSAKPACPRCGTSLSPNAPEGLCPRCLGALNFTADTSFTEVAAEHAAPPTPQEIAPHFPQLEVLECLGRGGMGVVYKARQKTLNRFVALKLLAPEREKDAQFAERFSREAQALAALNHPHIVTVHDFGQANGFFFLLMEYVDGVNLRELLRSRRLTPEEALSIVPPLCEALQYAHERGIVHRDIKPENLLLAKDGGIKVVDFGIAKMLGADAAQTTEERAAGTPGYMAPEQRETPQRVDRRADIYSLGVVFYEMLTGTLPSRNIEPPSRKVRLDVRIDEIVLRALENEPARRYQTANEVRAAVTSVVATPSIPSPTAGDTPEVHDPWPRRILWTLGLIVGVPVLLILVGLLVPYILTGNDRTGADSLTGWLTVLGVSIVWLVVLIRLVGSWRRKKEKMAGRQSAPSPWQPVVWAIIGMIAVPVFLVLLGIAIPALQRAREAAGTAASEVRAKEEAIRAEVTEILQELPRRGIEIGVEGAVAEAQILIGKLFPEVGTVANVTELEALLKVRAEGDENVDEVLYWLLGFREKIRRAKSEAARSETRAPAVEK